MTTVKADERRRVTIPCAEPGQEFAWREDAQGVVVLTPVVRVKPRKVRMSLVKRDGLLMGQLPKGMDFAADGISRAIREEREAE